jgi:putative hydrolase, CocE/NonD family
MRAPVRNMMAAASLLALTGASYEPSIIREYNVGVPMRDGTILSADVVRPGTDERVPVVLIRTPYGRATERYAEMGNWWAERGYAFVVQDVRGRGDSGGVFQPFIDEATDGFDTQSWAGRQSWSTGKVGTAGGSYLGWTQVYPASLNNPHLAAMIPAVTAPDPHRNFPLQFGVPMVAAAHWAALVDGRQRQSFDHVDLASAYHQLPLIDFDRAIGRRLPLWREWLDHPTYDDYWRAREYQTSLRKSLAPAMHVSGWYDDVLVGTLQNFAALSTRSPPAGFQKLVIGPWGHKVNAGRKLGAIDFGPQAMIDYDNLQKRWFDRWLKGIDNGIDREPPVRLFVMGANIWRDEWEWPLARTVYTRFYLRSSGRANGSAGDGRLDLKPPGKEPSDRFQYDPANPVPLITAPDATQVGGPDDYSEVQKRDDLLVYTTARLTSQIEVCGPIKVRLYASTSARDTDWSAQLQLVRADGYVQRLNDGIVRARYRRSIAKPEFVKPGSVEPYDIDLWATCIAVKPGERLRVQIASSAYPKFDRNLNTGGPIARESRGVIAHQQIFHDRRRPSHILLPIVPARAGR